MSWITKFSILNTVDIFFENIYPRDITFGSSNQRGIYFSVQRHVMKWNGSSATSPKRLCVVVFQTARLNRLGWSPGSRGIITFPQTTKYLRQSTTQHAFGVRMQECENTQNEWIKRSEIWRGIRGSERCPFRGCKIWRSVDHWGSCSAWGNRWREDTLPRSLHWRGSWGTGALWEKECAPRMLLSSISVSHACIDTSRGSLQRREIAADRALQTFTAI